MAKFVHHTSHIFLLTKNKAQSNPPTYNQKARLLHDASCSKLPKTLPRKTSTGFSCTLLSSRMMNLTKVASKAPESLYLEIHGFHLPFLFEFSLTQSPISVKPFL